MTDISLFFIILLLFRGDRSYARKWLFLLLAILLELWRKNIFHIFEKSYDQGFLNFVNRTAQYERALSLFKKNQAITFTVLNISAKYDNIWEKILTCALASMCNVSHILPFPYHFKPFPVISLHIQQFPSVSSRFQLFSVVNYQPFSAIWSQV